MPRQFLIIYILTTLVIVQDVCVGQLPDFQLKVLTEQQGLHPANFISLARDSMGFMWLLSSSKMQRYDGQHAWSFPAPQQAHTVFVDRKDQVWMLSRRYVHRFRNNYSGFTEEVDSGDTATVICLFYLHNRLHLLRSNDCMIYDEKQQKFLAQQALALPTRRKLISTFSANTDYLFVAVQDTVYSLNLRTAKWQATGYKRIATLTSLSGNRVIVSDMEFKSAVIEPGKQEYDGITSEQFIPALKNDFFRIYGGVALEKNTFHLSTSQGIWRYDDTSGRFSAPVFYHRGEKLANTLSARTLYRDAYGFVFMTTADGVASYHPEIQGIQYIRNYHFGQYSLPDPDVRSFAEDQENQLWIATLNGMSRLNRATGELTTYLAGEENSISYPSLRHLVYYRDRIWVGTGGKGIWIYNPSTSGFERPVEVEDSISARLNSEFIWRMVPLHDGSIFIAGGGSCYVIYPDKKIRRLDKEIFKGISRGAMQDAEGRIWHGTSSGINCTNASFELLFRLDSVFPDKRIVAFCEWKKDRMLIGTRGLYEAVIQEDKVESLRLVKGFPSNSFVYAIEQDTFGKVWLGTDEGLYRYDPVEDQSRFFGQAEHVQSQSFNGNGLFRSASGMMYAAGRGGINYFDPGRLDTKSIPLQPVIVAFNVAGDDSTFFQTTSPYFVPYANRSITVEISVPDFIRPHALQYRYRSNHNQNWLSNGNSRFIQLNHYAPDEYNLIVAASHDGVNWYESQPLSFKILTPWWLRWYVVMAFVIVLGAIVYSLYKSIQWRRYRKAQQEVIDYFTNSTYKDDDVDHILWDIAINCISRLGFEECVIYLVDAKRNVLVQKAAYGPKSPRQYEVVDPIEIPIGKGITGAVALTGKAEIISDTTKDPRYLVDDEARKSEITVPIIHEGKVIGIIDSESRRKNFYSKEQLQTLTTIAGICAMKVNAGLTMLEMKKAEAMVQEISTRMLETRYQNLRLQMNPHFLFNCLSSIQHLVVSRQTNEAYTYLSLFSQFLRSILQHADKNVITLEEELKMIDMYVRLERLGSDKEFNFTLDIDDSLDVEDVLIPPLLIQPLIENAIWHGLMPKDGERQLTVRFTNLEDHRIVCTIDDNGVGRSAADLEEKNLNGFSHQSKALSLITERLQLLEKRSGKNARMETVDKWDGGQAAGTQVTISLPYLNPDEV